jgi:glycosyltransferase involved in cell wall biosynthesis
VRPIFIQMGSRVMIRFSIIICTRDKPEKLRGAIKSLLRLDLHNCEIIVVDNGSPEGVLLLDEPDLGNGIVRVVREEIAGLSRARNTGANAARGEYLLYLDDDCLLSFDSLSAFSRALELYPGCACAGGTIIPHWPGGNPPEWLSPRFFWVYGEIRYENQEIHSLRRGETVNGGNLLVSRDLLLRLGGFRTDFGHVGNIYRGSEEQELLARIRAYSRDMVLAVPDAVAIHDFPGDRLTVEYARSRITAASFDRARENFVQGSFLIMTIRGALYLAYLVITRNTLLRAQCLGYLRGVGHSLRGKE